MNELDLTPPSKEKSAKAPKAAKTPKEAKVVDPNAPKKERAPRANYGFAPTSVISLTGKENKYRGARKEWFESITPYVGKSVAEWVESRKAQKDPPRGWLRFFVQDGTVALTAVATPVVESAKVN